MVYQPRLMATHHYTFPIAYMEVPPGAAGHVCIGRIGKQPRYWYWKCPCSSKEHSTPVIGAGCAMLVSIACNACEHERTWVLAPTSSK